MTEIVTLETGASAIQRAKRLTPRFYPSRKKWVVDLPPDMNEGRRAQKFFPNQEEAMRWCANRSMRHKMGIAMDRVKRTISPDSIAGLVTLYIAEKESKEASFSSISQTKTCLYRFADEFGHKSPKDIEPEDIENWLVSLNKKTRTTFNHYAQVRQFFNWRNLRKLVSVSPFQEVTPPKKSDKDVRREILTPETMAKLLALDLEPWTKCKLVLGGFAGLRTCEMTRMTYDCIDTEYKEINVTKEQSKGGSAMRPRSITLQDAVTRHMPTGEGPLVGNAKEWSWHRWMPKKDHLGGEHVPTNALRHSFASYHLAHFKDASKTAYELGHISPRLVYETYANAVSRREAAAWWAL